MILNICKAFRIKMIKDNHDLCLRIDVSLLACMFETFTNKSVNSFQSDPSLYISTPGYSWNIIKRFTGVSQI